MVVLVLAACTNLNFIAQCPELETRKAFVGRLQWPLACSMAMCMAGHVHGLLSSNRVHDYILFLGLGFEFQRKSRELRPINLAERLCTHNHGSDLNWALGLEFR